MKKPNAVQKGKFYAITGIISLWLLLFPLTSNAYPKHPPKWTQVERKFLASSGRQGTYPHENIAVLETRNAYELGKLTALRFIEWAKDNPNGVIAFTSGSTPEYFIKFLNYYKKNWQSPNVQAELQSYGIKLKRFPNTSNMKFVQLEELYPMASNHNKRISSYVERYYVKILGLKKENVLLMDLSKHGILAEKGMKVVFMNGKVDLSIMNRKATTQLESWQQQAIREVRAYCKSYENKIRAWGGIDFFVGGMSYGGHLGFNKPSGDINSKTHIIKLDYITASHAAKDLGGIEHARGKIAITIGLGTLAIKPNAVMIVIVSGESKAHLVRDAIEYTEDPKYPATVLQRYQNSRFYITAGAACMLNARITEDIHVKSKHGWTQDLIAEVIIDIAQAEKKGILDLTRGDIERHERGRLLLENPPKPLSALLNDVRMGLIRKIERGLKVASTKGNKILHTGPHHDDIILGYYPLIENLTYKYKNHFAYITSGFNSVSDHYILSVINRASDWWINKEKDAIFDKSYERVINQFKNYFVKQDIEQMNMLDTTLALKHLVAIYDIKDVEHLKQSIRWLKDEYFPSKQPGDSDIEDIKLFKGMMRESEADRLWSLKNVPLNNITHLRSKFYTGDEFLKTPRFDSDVLPFIKLYNQYRPDILTVDDDPQSAPPITHYRVSQLIAQALRSKEAIQNDNVIIWGYRNIWFRYSMQAANIFVPITEAMLAAEKRAFIACFNTQRMASFPSPFFEGDFSTLTVKIQRDQLADLKMLLGAEYFEKNTNPELRNAAGFVFIKQMTLNEFLQHVEGLQQGTDLEQTFESLHQA